MLSAHQRVVCDVCTVDSDQPVLVDGPKWDIHVRSRSHRRMTSKGKRDTRARPGRSRDEGQVGSDGSDDSEVSPSTHVER